MAVDMCESCGQWRDLDWEEGYCTVNGEYWCHSCCEDNLTEAEYDYALEHGNVEIGSVYQTFHFEAGFDVWQPEVFHRDKWVFIEPEKYKQKAIDKWWDWREAHPPTEPNEDFREPTEQEEWHDFDPDC